MNDLKLDALTTWTWTNFLFSQARSLIQKSKIMFIKQIHQTKKKKMCVKLRNKGTT